MGRSKRKGGTVKHGRFLLAVDFNLVDTILDILPVSRCISFQCLS